MIGAAVIIAIWAIWGLVQKANAKKDDVKDASPKHYVTKVSIPTPFSLNGQAESKQFSTLDFRQEKFKKSKSKMASSYIRAM